MSDVAAPTVLDTQGWRGTLYQQVCAMLVGVLFVGYLLGAIVLGFIMSPLYVALLSAAFGGLVAVGLSGFFAEGSKMGWFGTSSGLSETILVLAFFSLVGLILGGLGSLLRFIVKSVF